MSVNLRIGKISHAFSPGYSWCFRCLTTWNIVEHHSTPYTEWSACFPLCEKCWSELTPETRLPFYKQLWRRWLDDMDRDPSDWCAIERAVMAGL